MFFRRVEEMLTQRRRPDLTTHINFLDPTEWEHRQQDYDKKPYGGDGLQINGRVPGLQINGRVPDQAGGQP
jgi:hypothetical protein